MSKSAGKWFAAAVSLIVIGLVMLAAALWADHWDLMKLSTVQYETNDTEIREAFDSIEIRSDTADILFAASDDDHCKVVCYEQEKVKHAVAVRDGALTITAADDRAWYDHIGFAFRSPRITVYLPGSEYTSLSIDESTGDIEIPDGFTFDSVDLLLSTGDVSFSADVRELLKVKTSTGDIRICDTAAGDVQLQVSTGDVSVENSSCQNLSSNGSTGNIALKDVNAAEKIRIERSTGDVKLEGADAGEIFIKTSTGDVTGTLAAEKEFFTETSTGEVSVPKTAAGGRCEIITSTGDILISDAGSGAEN